MRNTKLISSVVLVSFLVFTGCGSSGKSDSNTTEEVFSGKEITIDATAGGFNASKDDPKNKYTYFDFSTDSDVNETDSWDIAFKRTSVILNGGSSGDGEVIGAVADLQSELYDLDGNRIKDKILALDANIGLVEFNKADSNVTAFMADSDGNAIKTEWWRDIDMSNMPPIIKANDDNWMIIKSSTGDSYAKLHVTDFTISANKKLSNISLEMYVQAPDDAIFSDTTQSIDIAFADGEVTKYYDFDTNALVGEDDDWDLKIDNDWKIWVNSKIYGGGDGGAFGRIDPTGRTLDQTNAMLTVLGGDSGANIPLYYTDKPAGIFSEYPWSEFKVDGGRKFWPLYRTYIVKVSDDEKYKVQLTNYYKDINGKSTSGYITMRYEKLD